MQKLIELSKRLNKITVEKQEKDILAIMKKHKDTLIDTQTRQLLDGRDASGELIDPPYKSKKYADFKLFLNPKGVVDLFLTGKFHKSIFVRIGNAFPIKMDAKDKKTKALKEKYGDGILGFNKESKEFIIGDVKPEIIKYYKSLLGIR